MLTLYGYKRSGNSYKAKLTCELLALDYKWVEIDIIADDNKQDDFLAINPLGQVPVLQIEKLQINTNNNTSSSDSNSTDQSTTLLESNAIIRYLANDSWLIPADPIPYAQMWQWLLYEQNEIRANIGPIRFIKTHPDTTAHRQEEYQRKFSKAQDALSYLDKQFSNRQFILGDNVSLADISLYAYSHVADKGGIDMSAYPHLKDWFKRIESLEYYVPL